MGTRSCLATLLLGLGAVLLGCAGPDPAPPGKLPVTTADPAALKAYLEGRESLEMLRATDAAQHFRRAVDIDPSFALAWWGMANAAAGPADFFSSLERAVKLAAGASPGEAILIRSTEAGANADPERQRALLEQLARDFPADERVHYQLGTYYFGQQLWEQAIAEFEQAIAIAPAYAPPYNHLGYCLRNLERYDEAERAFKKYTELVPDEPNPHDSYAELLMKVGRFGESIAEYERALEIDPNFTASYVGLGNNQIFLGRLDEARNTFARLAYIARSDGERRQALTWMAAAYVHEGDVAGALREIDARRAIAADAGDWLSVATDHNLRGLVLLDSGRAGEALADLDRAVEVIDRSYASSEVRETFRRNHLYLLARAALAAGDLERAGELAERYRAAAAPHRVPAEIRAGHELLGRLAMAGRDWPVAVENLLQANQQNPQILLLLAQAYEASGDRGNARTYAARAAHFNGLAFAYAFVRGEALAMLARLEREPEPAGAAVPALPRPAHVAAVA